MLSFVFRVASASTPFWHSSNVITLSHNYKIGSLRWHGICFAVPAPALLFWAISLCTIRIFTPIENPHLDIAHFGKTLWVYAQPAINLGSMLKRPMRIWVMPDWCFVLF